MHRLLLGLVILAYGQAFGTSTVPPDRNEYCGQLKNLHMEIAADTQSLAGYIGLYNHQGQPAYVRVRDPLAVATAAELLVPPKTKDDLSRVVDWTDMTGDKLVKVCVNYETFYTEYLIAVPITVLSYIKRVRVWINGRPEADTLEVPLR